MATQPTLTCKECNYENEIQRIHCHQCGRKLERSAAFEMEQKKKNEAEQKQRVEERKKIASKERGSSSLITLLSVLIRAALTAALILAALPPDHLPPNEPQGSSFNPEVVLNTLQSTTEGRQLAIPETSINDYFRTTIRPEKKAIPFQRLFSTLEDGQISFTLQHGWDQYSIYAGITYDLKIENDHLEATPLRASLGRLTLPAFIAKYSEKLFAPVWKNFSTQQEQMNQLKAITIRKGELILTAKGATASPLQPQQ